MRAKIGGQDVADRVEIGPTVVRHHSLGIAGRSRGVTECDGIPFVLRQPRDKTLVALRQRLLIFDFANPLAARKSFVVNVDDEGPFPLHQRQRLRDDRGKFRIHKDDSGAAMIELKRDRSRIKPDVERVEHRAGHRHGKMQFVHGWNVG